jgi:hypothetical protein
MRKPELGILNETQSEFQKSGCYPSVNAPLSYRIKKKTAKTKRKKHQQILTKGAVIIRILGDCATSRLARQENCFGSRRCDATFGTASLECSSNRSELQKGRVMLISPFFKAMSTFYLPPDSVHPKKLASMGILSTRLSLNFLTNISSEYSVYDRMGLRLLAECPYQIRNAITSFRFSLIH